MYPFVEMLAFLYFIFYLILSFIFYIHNVFCFILFSILKSILTSRYFGTRRSAQRLLKITITEILREEGMKRVDKKEEEEENKYKRTNLTPIHLGNEGDVVEDYVHPNLKLPSSSLSSSPPLSSDTITQSGQCVTFDIFVPSLNMAFEYPVYRESFF